MFGLVLKDFLSFAGAKEITIFDSKEANSGTSASGNITKPSWVSGLKEAKQAYTDLEQVYGLQKFSPEIALGKTIDLFYVDRNRFLERDDVTYGKVIRVGDGWLELDNGDTYAGYVIVAAGAWSSELVETPQIDKVMGVSLLFKKQEHKAKFNVWAPYKQSISYSQDDIVWFGDGSAIKHKNFEINSRIEATIQRASGHDLFSPYQINVGTRPYVKGHKNGYYAKVHPNTWVSTGGGKNGIVLAAIQSRRFIEEIS